MPEREKVIKGLETCSAGEWNSTGGRDHTDCPYYPAGYTGCTCKLLMRDALALLKAQEPRVMTLEKAQTALHNDDVVWVELKDKIICGGIRMDETDYFTMQNGDVLDVTDFDSEESAEMYGKEVRCWTSRPDQATREATPWERLK